MNIQGSYFQPSLPQTCTNPSVHSWGALTPEAVCPCGPLSHCGEDGPQPALTWNMLKTWFRIVLAARGQVDANGYGNSNVTSPCQGRHMLMVNKCFSWHHSILLWPIKGPQPHHSQAKQRMNYSTQVRWNLWRCNESDQHQLSAFTISIHHYDVCRSSDTLTGENHHNALSG